MTSKSLLTSSVLMIGLSAVASAAPAAGLPARAWTVQVRGILTRCQPAVEGSIPQCAIPGNLTDVETPLSLTTPAVPRAGQAASASVDFDVPGSTDRRLVGRLTIFAIMPKAESALPPYDQLRIELVSPVRATCLSSVKFSEQDLPPLFCLTYDTSGDEWLQMGARLTTIHWDSIATEPTE